MTSRTQGIVFTLIAAVCIRLAVSDVYLRFVKPWMKWPLLLTAAVLLALAARTVIRVLAPEEEPTDTPHAAWLMLLPVLAVFVISPPALGAYAAEHNPVVATSDNHAAQLAKNNSVIAMSLSGFVTRAQWDNTLAGRRIALTGFVSKDRAGEWFVTRLAISCCAADAVAYRVQVTGVEEPKRDAWIRVTGTWKQPATNEFPRIHPPPVIEAESITSVPVPRNTYE